MDQNLEKKIDIKDKIYFFFKKNRIKMFFILLILIIFIFSVIFIKYSYNKKNELISEKFLQASTYYSSKNLEKSKEIYDEIIFSKNKFYSILALNNIIDKDLEKDNEKILKYFEFLENINLSKENKELLRFKKSLYLLKIDRVDEGNNVLENILKNDSKYKSAIKNIISNK